MQAEVWRALIVPFRPDPWEGRAMLYAPQLVHYDHATPDRRKRNGNHAPAGAELDPLPEGFPPEESDQE